MTIDLTSLKANLVELHAWAKSSDQNSPSTDLQELIPNADLTRIYYAGYFMGKAWRLYYRLLFWMSGEDILPECRQKALNLIQNTFKSCREKACADNNAFLNATLNPVNSKTQIGENIMNVKEEIYQTCLTIQPFIKALEEDAVHCGLQRLNIIDHRAKSNPSFLSEGLILCESLTGARMPLALMHKLSLNKKLSRLEELQLKFYLEKFKKQKRNTFSKESSSDKTLVDVRFFHRLLRKIVDAFNQSCTEDSLRLASVAILETRLHEYGLDLFEQEDDFHMTWRQALPGKTVKIGKEQLEVGPQVGAKQDGRDRYALFSLPQAPHLLLKTGINEASLGIDACKLARSQFGIPYANYTYWDPKNRFVLVERIVKTFQEGFSEYHRGAGNGAALYSYQDLLDNLKRLPGTPEPLSPQSIGFTADGHIRTFKPMYKSQLDPTALEKFAFACSGGDHILYADLMVRSRLFSADEIQFYQTVLQNTLKDSSWPTLMASLTQWQFNKNLRAKGEEFACAIKQMRVNCLMHLTATYAIKDKVQFHKILDYCITVYHREKCIGSYLKPTFVQDVCFEVANYLKLEKLPLEPKT